MRRFLTCSTALLLVAAAVVGIAWTMRLGPGPGPAGLEPAWKVRRFGVNWEVAGPVREADVDWLASTGANGVVQMPFPRQRDTTKPFLEEPDYRVWGQRDVGLRKTSRLLRARGIATLLKPHLFVVDRTTGYWPGDIRMTNEADWQSWFARYRDLILGYAGLAAEEGMETFCVGAELRQTLSHEKEWRALIAEVRKRYPGCVMYSVNWDDYEDFKLADAVDAIGVQAYFPLSERLRPTTLEMEDGWEQALWRFEAWVAKVGKPIVFTEVGFHSCLNAAAEPWQWKLPGMAVDFDLQADAYTATLRTLRARSWLRGLYFWKWVPGHPRPATDDDDEYHPQGKPAEDVMRRHFLEETRPLR